MATETIAAPAPSDDLLVTVAEHWMKTRIEAPLAAVDRLDQNAKQLIALAATLQGVLVAVVKIAHVQDPLLLAFALFAFFFLFASIAGAALAIHRQVAYIGLTPIVNLLNSPRDQGMVRILDCQIETMCTVVDDTLRYKQKKLALGLGFFTISLLGSFGCLTYMLVKGLTASL